MGMQRNNAGIMASTDAPMLVKGGAVCQPSSPGASSRNNINGRQNLDALLEEAVGTKRQPLHWQRGGFAANTRKLSTPELRRQRRRDVSDYSQMVNAYAAILQRVDVDMSIKALDWWARNHVTSRHVEQAIEIAKRNGKVSAGYIARVVGNHIDPNKPHSLDRGLDRRDIRSRTFHAGEPWRESQKEELRDLVARRWPIQRIAETFSRTPVAIQNAIVRVHNGPVDGYPVYPDPIPSIEDWFRVPTFAEIRDARERST